MREILFRGKREDNGDWVYGSFIPDLCEVYYGDKLDGFIKPFGKTKEERLMVEVDRKTVGQYTGLTDKNGTKIFEGDVVNYNGSIHKVVFEDRCYNARFGIVVEEKETWSFGVSVPPYLMEVIGNIYDNPELMGG